MVQDRVHRGQSRAFSTEKVGGVLWAFKRRKCVEIAKRALLAHLGLEHAVGRFDSDVKFFLCGTCVCAPDPERGAFPATTARDGGDNALS